MHDVLVNRLGGLSLPRKSVVRLTDRPDMTLDVYRGRKTTIQSINFFNMKFVKWMLSLDGTALPAKPGWCYKTLEAVKMNCQKHPSVHSFKCILMYTYLFFKTQNAKSTITEQVYISKIDKRLSIARE